MAFKKKVNFFSTLIVAMMCSASLTAFAASDSSQSQQQQRPPQGMPPGPPPEAVAACNSLTANATCSFTGRNKETVTGVCATPPPRNAPANEQANNGQTAVVLACRPNHPPQGMPSNGNGAPPNSSN